MRTVFYGLVLLGACKPPSTAFAAYSADLIACTDAAKTKAESKACEAEVDKRWGVRLDGGSDAP